MEVFDPRGDLELVIGPEKTVFQVCSRALARSSPVWDVMLYGSFAEEDSVEGLRLALHAAHGNLTEIPPVLPQATLYAAVTVADKYDMVECLTPWWRGWIDALPDPRPDPHVLVQRLLIFCLLGDECRYRMTLKILLSCSRRDPKSGSIWSDRQEYDLRQDSDLDYLEISPHLESARHTLFSAVGKHMRHAMERLINHEASCCKSKRNKKWKRTCDCAMLGAVLRMATAMEVEAWFERGRDDDFSVHTSDSLFSLIVQLENMRHSVIDESGMSGKQNGAHRTCTPWPPFEIIDIWAEHPVEDLFPINPSQFLTRCDRLAIGGTDGPR
ncbi:uncharacterized protein B0T15DRAFT_545201 [Chaetomium strumarium]|uniref:Nuclear pore protein n=1 Tax=Chaetomium strumarium TaxID=1170767 RepID=A0AAJ0M5A9_9PEZI|nr:hypothetical protein B0T15DRAFT_545201 [Chaetomium strumarium]